MKKHHFWLLAALVGCLVIFMTTGSPSATGGNTKFLLKKYLSLTPEEARKINFILRKSVHLAAFGLLAVLLYNGLRKNFFLAWVITTLYAATDEIHQAFIPARTASIVDVGLDSLGALLALWLIRNLEKQRLDERSYKQS